MVKRTAAAIVVLAVVWLAWPSNPAGDSRAPELDRPPTAIDDRMPERHHEIPLAALEQNAPSDIARPEPIPLAAGTPVGELTVLVQDNLGEALAGVPLYIYGEAPREVRHDGLTAEDGRARLSCEPRDYFLIVNKDQTKETHGKSVSEVAVGQGSQEVVITLARLTAGMRLLARDALGTPAAGVLVEATGPARAPEPRRTDERGEVSWSNLHPGRWRFHAEETDDPTLNLDSNRGIRVELVADVVTSAEWLFERKGQLVVDLSRVPILDDLESLSVRGEGTHHPPWPFEVTFLVEPDDHTLMPTWSPTSAHYSPHLDVRVEEAEVVRVQLLVETGSVSASGRVVDTSGRPIEGVRITSNVGSPATDERPQSWLARKSLTTDARGEWSMRGLPVGEVYVSAYATRAPGRHLDPSVHLGLQSIPADSHIDCGDTVITPAVYLACELTGSWQGTEEETELARIDPPPVYDGSHTDADIEEPDLHVFDHVVPGEYVLRLLDEDGEVIDSQTLFVPADVPEGERVRFRVGDGEPQRLTDP